MGGMYGYCCTGDRPPLPPLPPPPPLPPFPEAEEPLEMPLPISRVLSFGRGPTLSLSDTPRSLLLSQSCACFLFRLAANEGSCIAGKGLEEVVEEKGGGKAGRKEDRVAVVGVGGEGLLTSRCLGGGNTTSSPDEPCLCCCWLYRRMVKPPKPDPNPSLPSPLSLSSRS